MTLFSFIKSKLSILDVVLEYVQLRRIGGYWKGPCPFHQEKDASFTVSPDKQIFYCFGCHAGGDLIAFVAKAENLSPYEASCHLIDKFNITVPSEIKKDLVQTGSGDKKDQYFLTCHAVAQWCYDQLLLNIDAKNYLIARSIQESEREQFLIGYLPGGTHSVNRFVKEMSSKNVLLKDLMNAGIILQGRSSLYSPFEERILFPIRDVLGRFCGFGGRIFRPQDDRAKYYNSRESDWFSKGKLLFGLDLAKKDLQARGNGFLVEGYTDCIAMVSSGYTNTVATLGTACTKDHLQQLSRYINTLYVLYDGDRAGQKAILRLTKLCWEANLDLQIITLPEKDDPASFLQGGGRLDSLIEQACDIFSFFVNSLGEQFWGTSLSEKMQLCGDIVGVIAKIDDRFKQDLLLQQASEVMQVPFSSLKELLFDDQRIVAGGTRGEAESFVERNDVVSKSEPFKGLSSLEQEIVSFVFNGLVNGKVLQVDKDVIPYFSEEMQSVLAKIDVFLKAGDGLGVGDFNEFLNGFDISEERDWILSRSFVANDEISDESFERLLFRFRKKNWKNIVQGIKKQIFEAKRENDSDKLQNLLSSFSSLKKEMKMRGLI